MRWFCVLILSIAGGSYAFAQGKISYTISNGLQLTGVDETNPVIYDNDWVVDTPEDEFLWLKAHNGQIKLVGNIITRDMYDCILPNNAGCYYTLQQNIDAWKSSYELVQQMGLRNIPQPVAGADGPLIKPGSGRIEDTQFRVSTGSELIIAEANKASAAKPLLIFIGGNITTVANAYLKDPSIADKIIVFHIGGYRLASTYNTTDKWSSYITMKKLKYIAWEGDFTSWYHGQNVNVTQDMINSLPNNPLANSIKGFWWQNAFPRESMADSPPALYFFNHSLWKNVQRVLENDQVTTSDTYDYLRVSENDWLNFGPTFVNYMKDPANYVVGTPANTLPVVTLSSPANNASFPSGTSVTLTANASDANGSVAKVEFFDGTTKLGEDLTSPYSIAWSNASVGSHNLSARATDNQSAVANSPSITITITNTNTPPTVSLTAPANNSSFAAGSTVTITANASDNGAISKVEFYNGTAKLGEDLTSPYTFSWTNVQAGAYSISAAATDNQNARTTSSTLNITVTAGNSPPLISLTAPANNASYAEGASISITASASDANGAVNKVEFFNGTTKLGEDLTSPYSFSWSNVPAGSYSLTAKATDNQNAVTTSSAISVTVTNANQPPTVSITGPSNNSTFTAGANVTISATASDPNGTIGKVEFFSGTSKLGEDLTTPYSFLWNNVPAGTYSITAKATDNQNAVATSTAIVISIGNPPPIVSITGPSNNSTFTAGTNVTITATASDPNGTIGKVEFFSGTSKLGEDLTSPYSYTWNKVPSGTYSITAKATDNQNAVATSAAISITVTNPPPTVALTGPSDNSAFPAGTTVTITASATDPNGTVGKVEFYNGSLKLGEDATSPYTFVWSNAPAGSHSITAKATDNLNAVSTSKPVTISVKTLVNPTANAGEDIFLTLPDNAITLIGSGVSGDGSALRYNWTQLSGPSTPAIFNAALPQINLAGLLEGAYIFELTVTDAKGLTGKDQTRITIGPSQVAQSAIPRYFTPNQDGINDFWEWPKTEILENSLLSIFNRFGEKIYEEMSYQNTWDGTASGKPLQEDAYYYIIKLFNRTEIKGAVRIIR